MEKIKITTEIMTSVNSVAEQARAYEQITGRRMPITSEVGEVLVCYHLKLDLVKNAINQSFDAFDKDGKKVQIKTRREGPGSQRTGNFYSRDFDYALLAILDDQYRLKEVYKAAPGDLFSHLDQKNKKRLGNGRKERLGIAVRDFIKLAGEQPLWKNKHL